VSFGGKNPDKCCIILNGNKVEWIEKLTYLSCQFFSHASKVDFIPMFGNFMEVSTLSYLFLVRIEMKSPVCTLLRLIVCLRYSVVVKFGICHVQSIDI